MGCQVSNQVYKFEQSGQKSQGWKYKFICLYVYLATGLDDLIQEVERKEKNYDD